MSSPGLRTFTLTRPTGPAGVMTRRVLAFRTSTSAAGRPKNDTTTPSTKPTPLMITASPPSLEPRSGLTAVIRSTGGAT